MMDNSALRETLLLGRWSIEFKAGFTKQTSKGKKKLENVASGELPGRVPGGQDDALMKFVYQLAECSGWHFLDGIGVNVAHGAKSFRSPQPRFSLRDFPLRTTVAGWMIGGKLQWRILEEKVDLRDLNHLQEQIEVRTSRLLSFFSKATGNQSVGHIK